MAFLGKDRGLRVQNGSGLTLGQLLPPCACVLICKVTRVRPSFPGYVDRRTRQSTQAVPKRRLQKVVPPLAGRQCATGVTFGYLLTPGSHPAQEDAALIGKGLVPGTPALQGGQSPVHH